MKLLAKYYTTSSGVRGYVNGEWMEFPTSKEYFEYLEEIENKGEEDN